MAIDYTAYQQPGVYVSDDIPITNVTTTQNEVVVALIGKASGYVSKSEPLQFLPGDTEGTALSYTPVGDVALINRYGKRYIDDEDYSVSGNTVVRSVTVKQYDTETPGAGTVNMDLSAGANTIVLPVGASLVSATAETDDVTPAPIAISAVDLILNTITVAAPFTNAKVEYTYTMAQPFMLVDSAQVLYLSNAVPARNINKVGATSGVVVTNVDGDEFTEGEDFTVSGTKGDWKINRVIGGTIPTDEVCYASFGECAIAPNELVNVVYTYTPVDYYEPRSLRTMYDVVNWYGNPFKTVFSTDQDSIESPLALGAQVAFQNGASSVLCVPTTDTTYDSFLSAVAKLETISNVDIVIPLSANESVQDAVASHVINQSLISQERRAFFGADGVSAVKTASDMIAFADTYNTQRVAYVSPSTFAIQYPYDNSTVVKIPGFYGAAAIAGLVARNGRFSPITGKSINGIRKNEFISRQDVLDQSAAGLCVINDKNGLSVVHGRTTDNTSDVLREISMAMNHDFIVRTMRDSMSNGIIGMTINASTIGVINSIANSSMSGLVSGGYCSEFTVQKVRQLPEQPTAIEVAVQYKPIYSLNYIYLSIAVDTVIG